MDFLVICRPVPDADQALFGQLLAGAVVIETVFNWPGVGQLVIQSVKLKDFPVVEAALFLVAVIFVTINFGVDLLYTRLDPRVRLR